MNSHAASFYETNMSAANLTQYLLWTNVTCEFMPCVTLPIGRRSCLSGEGVRQFRPGDVPHLIYIQDGKRLLKNCAGMKWLLKIEKRSLYYLEERLQKGDCGLGSSMLVTGSL